MTPDEMHEVLLERSVRRSASPSVADIDHHVRRLPPPGFNRRSFGPGDGAGETSLACDPEMPDDPDELSTAVDRHV
jgi:hypothetical protein